MSETLYNLGIFLYRVAIALASPFYHKAKKMKAGRAGVTAKIKADFEGNTAPVVWFHCASLGEFEQGRPVIERFRDEFPGFKILITFFSPSGYEVMKNYAPADHIFYLPWDTERHAADFVSAVNPTLTVFIKYEYWHHYIKQLRHRQKTILSVSPVFRAGQIYFKPYGRFYLRILKRITHFFVQNEASEKLLKKHGIGQVTVTGDTRFDRVYEIAQAPRDLPPVERFKGSAELMVVGSCWPEDLEPLMPVINSSEMKFIIAPHEVDGPVRKAIAQTCRKKVILYSDLENSKGDEQVLVIDNIGLLSSLYRYGDYAYVGGAFGAGLHNILEAATYGIPVMFGDKNYKKFNEAVELINRGGAVAISDERSLRAQLNRFGDRKARELAGKASSTYVKENTGATDKVIARCHKILSV